MNEKKREQENVLRLVKKSRKGILRVVFSRFGLMALLLVLELVLLWMMWRWFNNDFEWFAAVQGVFTVLMFFHLFNSDMDATGKLTWMFLLAVIPIPASIFLWFTEKDVGHRPLKRMVQQRIDESRDLLHQDPEVLRDPEIESSGTDDLCRYLNRSGSFPLYANTETKFFPQGEDKFAALLEELQKAEKFIFLEYFIIDEGYMWGSILKILADKAAQGVDVRVLYDGMLEISTLPWDYPRRLEKLVNEFFEITRYDLRQTDLKRERIDLYYLLAQMADELYPILSRRGNTAVLRADEDLTVCGDPTKLARVFNNILKNAAAYSDPNTEILIRGERWEDGVAVTIQNQGPAIPAEKLSAIFEKFYRTDEARASDTGGAGLGLAIAKEIVTLHGGTITAESRENTTTFTVTLPGSPSENLNPPLGSS